MACKRLTRYAAPLLEGVTSTLDLESVEQELDIVNTLPVELPVRSISLPISTEDLTNTLDLEAVTEGLNLPVKRLLGLSTDDLTKEVDLEAITESLSLPVKRLLGLDGLLGTVTGLLDGVLAEVNSLEARLTAIVADVENLDVTAALAEVETAVNDLLAQVQSIAATAGVTLDLSTLNPTLETLSTEVNDLLVLVGELTYGGVVGDTVTEIKGVLGDVLAIVKGLLG